MTDAAARFLVSGRVQGVWFRASARREGARLGLSGWARNLADGRVEVLATGDSEALESLWTWLHQGPPLAEVSSVERFEAVTGSCEPGHNEFVED